MNHSYMGWPEGAIVPFTRLCSNYYYSKGKSAPQKPLTVRIKCKRVHRDPVLREKPDMHFITKIMYRNDYGENANFVTLSIEIPILH